MPIPSFAIILLLNSLLHIKSSLQDFRLPKHLTPEKYKLEIFSLINSEPPVFWGDVLITVTCNDNTKMITLHKKDLDINKDDVKINLENSKLKFFATNHYYNPENDQYTMTLNAELIQGYRYEIFIPFEGKFSLDSTGYFLFTRTYQNGSSEQKKLIFATTILGMLDARRVFPCFDEMEMKAKFTISLAHPKTVISFSNMNKVGDEEISIKPNTWTMDYFAESMAIPPSAVAIALIPDESQNLTLNSQMPLQIWADRSVIYLPKFECQKLIKAFNYYEEYLTVPFAFPNLNAIIYDSLGTDRDDKYGVMIVGGSCMIDIVYRSIGFRQFEKVLEICYQLSHHWIDTHVIMTQRNENWLHEALDLHLSSLCVNKVSPSWRHTFSDIYIVDTFLFTLKNDQDGLINQLLISENDSNKTAKPVDAAQLRKAQFLIRMLNFIMGDEVFQLSINKYIQGVTRENSNLDQVWATFSETAMQSEVPLHGLTIKEIMNSWITQKGYPLLIVTVKRENNRVLIEQKRFKLLDELNEKRPRPKSGPECWTIPLSYMRKSELESETGIVREWITCDKSATIDISLNQDEWILVSLNLDVFSRTSYDPRNWNLLAMTLNSDEFIKINVMTRVKLVSDAFELSKVGLLEYKILFDIIKYLIYENSLLPWKVAAEELENIRIQLIGTNVSDLYEAYIVAILKPAFEKMYNTHADFSRSDSLESKLKKTVTQLSCNFGFNACKDLCTIFFNDWYEGIDPYKNNPIPHNIRDTVYCQVIKEGGEKEWNFLKSHYYKEKPDQVNDMVLDALGCSSNRQTLEKYLKWSLDKTKILPSDSFKVFRSLSKNKMGYELMKNFFTKNFKAIYTLHSEENLLIDSYFITLFDLTMKENDLNELLKLVVDHQKKLGEFDKIFNHHVSVASRNVLWLRNYELQLLDILKN